MIRVQGHCPMGCGETLFLGDGGYVTCSWHTCPSPTAVSDILADPECLHIVEIDGESFAVQHPLRERIKGRLFRCGLHAHLAGLSGPPRRLGTYRVFDDWGTWMEVPS